MASFLHPVEIQTLVQQGKTCLVLGRSRAGKTKLIQNILRNLPKTTRGRPLVTNFYSKRDYQGLASFSYSLTRKDGWISNWAKRMLEGRVFIIEDLNILMADPKRSRAVKQRMEALITRRRYCLFVICQNLGKLGWMVRNFRTVVMFKIDNGINLGLLLRTGRTDLITKRLSALKGFEYFLIDTETKKMSEHTYLNTQVEPIFATMLHGINGITYDPVKRQRTKLNEDIPKILKCFIEVVKDQTLPYSEIGRSINTSPSQVGYYINLLRNRKLLPNKPKGTWTGWDIQQSLKKAKEFWKQYDF